MGEIEMSVNEELKFRNRDIELRNRLVKAATTEALSDEFNCCSERMIEAYRRWIEDSGVGMIITGNILVDRRFLERPFNICIDRDFPELIEKQKEDLKELAKLGAKTKTKMVVQLCHAGRAANPMVSKVAIGPMAQVREATMTKGKREIIAASKSQIEDIKERFILAARVCQDCGFDGVQIHAAYGFFLASMLSPFKNKRRDEYCGSVEKRFRVLLEILEEVKSFARDDFLVAVKFNNSVFKGFTEEDIRESFRLVLSAGVDLIELSGSQYELRVSNQKTREGRKQFFFEILDLLNDERSKMKSETKVLVTGGVRSVDTMNFALNKDGVDLLGIGRPLCIDPSCTKRLLDGDVTELPRTEVHWKLPLCIGWKYFRGYKNIHNLTKTTEELVMYDNIWRMGEKKFKPQSNTKHPNLLTTSYNVKQKEKKQATLLRAHRTNDPFIIDTLKGK